ncbi:hypothetical protein QFC24_001782 [Naganishia onofrii]|uniref:Uncharacterized protein n=1 Tax=Naganishia onofrii TaxID=1851511 RepID=A0ACC2XTN4_9TREE|nr:hypothetical protein QFC24_001782 [Naganishia onofrii]
MNVNPRTQILALVAPKRFRYRSTTPLTRRQLATQPPPRANLDPPLSASTQDLLNRLAKEAAKNNAPGATVRPGGSALGQDGNVGGGKPYVGSVGPFGLGVGLGSNIRNKDWKKWRELGLGGKAYALTTELFAKNSPTVLHNQAIDMIESSKTMQQHLLKPYSFTHSSSASSTTRHSSPVQTQHTRHPQTQNEHLIMRFWVHGRGKDEVEFLGWLYQPFRDARGWLEVQYEQLMEQYLMDRLDDDGTQTHDAKSTDRVEAAQQQQQESSWFGGMFGALKPSSQGPSRNGIAGKGRKALQPAGTYTSGEVHADFLKDPETQTYRLLTLTVDIPSSKVAAQRAVVFWGDQEEVAREGLLEGSRTRLTW